MAVFPGHAASGWSCCLLSEPRQTLPAYGRPERVNLRAAFAGRTPTPVASGLLPEHYDYAKPATSLRQRNRWQGYRTKSLTLILSWAEYAFEAYTPCPPTVGHPERSGSRLAETNVVEAPLPSGCPPRVEY